MSSYNDNNDAFIFFKGGMEVISKERKWSAIGHKMGYVTSRCLGSVLKHHYERILYPYDIFKSGKHIPKHVVSKLNYGKP